MASEQLSGGMQLSLASWCVALHTFAQPCSQVSCSWSGVVWGRSKDASSSPRASLWVFLQCRASERWQSSGSRGEVSSRLAGGQGSVESTAPQIFGDDDVRHSIKDKLDVVGVRGAGDMGVDFLVS